MSASTHLHLCVSAAAVLVVAARAAAGAEVQQEVEDWCQRCVCLPPGATPTQAICHENEPTDKVFSPSTSELSHSLELVYIHGMSSVVLRPHSLDTDSAVTLLVHNCTDVTVGDEAVPMLRTLVVRGAARVQVGVLPRGLWATVLESLQELRIGAASLTAEYSVSIGRVEALTVVEYADGEGCVEHPQLKFLLFNSKIKPLPKGGISLCGGEVSLNGNTFSHVAVEGVAISAEEVIVVVYNTFNNVSKQSFNLTAPGIHISSNHFHNFPAGVLRDVSTIQDTFFTNNTIEDIDLGGVLLDMGWDMILERNTIACDCASKRTSILNPKEDMIYLTNSSYEKLQNIFHFNFCQLNCTISLMSFSSALKEGDVCLTNDTKLEEDILCQFTTDVPDTSTMSVFDEPNSTMGLEEVGYSTGSKLEIIVPLIVVSIALLFSLLYGCRGLNSFKYKFKPNEQNVQKISYLSSENCVEN